MNQAEAVFSRMIVNYELLWTWKEAVVAYFRRSAVICMERLRKSTKNSSQNSRFPGRDLKLRPLGAEILTTQARYLVIYNAVGPM
jgi:hypothetical protein